MSFINKQEAHQKSLPSKETPVSYIDRIYSEMPFSSSHFLLVIAMLLLRIIDGSETMALSISSSMMVKYFSLTPEWERYISGFVFLGYFNGCLTSCFISDRFPRKYSLYIGNSVIVTFGLLSLTLNNVVLFIICRHMVIFGEGLCISCTSALVAENINKEFRGFFLNCIIISASIGEVMISLSLGTIIDNSDPTQWRNLLLISQTPVSFIF